MLSQIVAGKEGVVLVTKVPLTTIAQHFDVTSGMQWAALLFQIGVVSFGFLVPALAGFIAFAIADRPGIVPGFVGGVLSATWSAPASSAASRPASSAASPRCGWPGARCPRACAA